MCRQFSSAIGWSERLTQVTLRCLKPFPQEAEHYVGKKREKESHAGKQLVTLTEYAVRIVLVVGITGCSGDEFIFWGYLMFARNEKSFIAKYIN